MFSDSSAQQTARQSAQRVITAGVTDGELQTLARSSEVKVRAAVAEHAGTPLMTLLRLAEDPAADVRMGLARNRRESIPIEIREDLAKDRNVDVVYALIDNPAVPDALIARLGRQLHKEYAKAARARMAAVKAGTWAPAAPAADAVDAAVPAAEVPAFAAAEAATVQDPRQEPATSSARADALDVLLGSKR
ncbi:hypothetical protein QQX09_07175 [Demequina sp. SYSU T00192]|uniref:DUF2336 domain-containing protein n=1 Tax=Demequina litoralis TaxID=3051660 RepID=A0ABT8G989_9MICO|nr:hypothetical protein [Demequina sp. SYSU T00192]MDN4475632.1 hypothetical protein [Demequina sp. SYSU T00192]